MAKIHVINKTTGQKGTVSEQFYDPQKYQLVQDTQQVAPNSYVASSQPDPHYQYSPDQGGKMSGVSSFFSKPENLESLPSKIGGFTGSLVGSPLGPLGRTAGAGLGAEIGETIAHPNDENATTLATQSIPPIALIRQLMALGEGKGITNPYAGSKAYSEGQHAAGSQAFGEVLGKLLGGGLDFMKKGPGRMLDEAITSRAANAPIPQGGSGIDFANIANRTTRSIEDQGNRLIPQGDKSKAIELLKQIMGETEQPQNFTDVNELRKTFNGTYTKDATSPLIDRVRTQLGRVLREAQVEADPMTGKLLPLKKAISYDLPNFIQNLPFLGNTAKSIGGLAAPGGPIARTLTPSSEGLLGKLLQFGTRNIPNLIR